MKSERLRTPVCEAEAEKDKTDVWSTKLKGVLAARNVKEVFLQLLLKQDASNLLFDAVVSNAIPATRPSTPQVVSALPTVYSTVSS